MNPISKYEAMTTQQILTADLLDIIFDNRNKLYGAYVLRREYPQNLLKAVGFMLLLVAIVCLAAFMMSGKNISINSGKDKGFVVTLDPYKEKEKPKEIEEKRKVADQPPTKRDYVPVIVENPDTTKQVPDRSDTSYFVPGPENKAGTGNGNDYVQGEKGETTVTPKEPVVEEPAIIDQDMADVQPEFPGGVEGWRRYLSNMLRMPEDLEAGDKRTVKVKFVVNVNGEITDAEIMQSAGVAFDREVLRVIGKMPKWKPGKQHGKNIAVYFTQPVTFVAEAE